jgi:hypothetical protein
MRDLIVVTNTCRPGAKDESQEADDGRPTKEGDRFKLLFTKMASDDPNTLRTQFRGCHGYRSTLRICSKWPLPLCSLLCIRP